MIFVEIFALIFLVVKTLISYFPSIANYIPVLWASYTGQLLDIAFTFFPKDVFETIIDNVVFWMGIQFAWAIIEWLYRKLPGVD